MKILGHGYVVLLSNIILIISMAAINNGDKEADYMFQVMKALTPKGWSNSTHHCNWKGISCNSTTQAVTSIILPSSSLIGTLPPNIYTLTNLTHIHLHNNSLNGPLPYFHYLVFLQTVSLGNNNFTSCPYQCIYYLPQLRTLNLSSNLNLSNWVFPMVSLSFSKYLNILDLQATNMIGSLPSQTFDSFPNLHTFVISHNQIDGNLPESLGKSSVTILQLNNQGGSGLQGKINLISSMPNLSQAWLHNNSFSDRIPNMSSTHLYDLQLHSNQLFGLIPPSLTSLPKLSILSLGDNWLQGPIPLFRKGLKAALQPNYFCRTDVGPCDPQIMVLLQIFETFGPPLFFFDQTNACQGEVIYCERGKVVSIRFKDQVLSERSMGIISPAFSKLTHLVNLTLSGNKLTGSIPQSLTTLPQLKNLDLSNNNLSGVIPKFSSNVTLNTTGNALLGGENATTVGDVQTRGSSKANRRRVIWIIGALAAGFGATVLIIIIFKQQQQSSLISLNVFRKRRTLVDNNVEVFMRSHNLSMPRRYSYAEVKRITHSFRDILGRGGYGVVYKAILSDGRQVAVKVINEVKGNGEEFINEVASISRTSHMNIVSLLGFCYEVNKRALIYEFMPKGSLDKFINKREIPNAICDFDWNTMFQIATGIARGLEYLHHGCSSRILHLDIKPQNILLDEDFCPKISDFGLAKICQKNNSIVSVPGTIGTVGFIAPEVFSRAFGGVSYKSDVYSYGMLVLEMIGGRKNYDTGGTSSSETYFPDWIYKDLEQGNNNLENRLEISEEKNDLVRKITMVSLWCIQTKPSDRPSMNKVIEMLQGPLQSVPYPPKPLLYSPELPSLQISDVSSRNSFEQDMISQTATASASIVNLNE